VTRYALIAALALLCAALGWIAYRETTLASLEAHNASLTASVASLTVARDQAQAAEVAAAELAEVQRRRAVAFQLVKENVLAKTYGGCADALIDPELLLDLSGLRTAN